MGVEYQIDGVRYTARSHRYHSNGRLALEVLGPEGVECILTVNLHELPLEQDQIHVREFIAESCEQHLRALNYEFTGKTVGYGPFDAKAQVWAKKE